MNRLNAMFCAMLAFAAGAATVKISGVRADADAPLEPSIQNEVDHAIAMAEKAVAAFAPRRETREELALRLVSTQRADGTWPGDAESATRENLRILKSL